MKKFLLYIIASVFISTTSFAQIVKGDILLGFNISTSFYETDDTLSWSPKTYNYTFTPSLSFAIKDNNTVGFLLTYGRSKTHYESGADETDYYGAGAFYSRYFPLGKGFSLLGQAGLSYNLLDNEVINDFSRTINKKNSIRLGLSPGLAYTINKRIQLETGLGNLMGLGYEWNKSRNIYAGGESETKSTEINFHANANASSFLSIGLRYTLGKK